MKQKTLKGSFSLYGKGLHTGLNLTVTFNPAPENHGYKIQRIDMEGEPTIDAIAENVVDTQRGQGRRSRINCRTRTLGTLCFGHRQLSDTGQRSGISHSRRFGHQVCRKDS